MKRLLIFLLPLIALCSCSKENDEVLPGSIYGIITEEGSSQPIEGLTIELYKEMAEERGGLTIYTNRLLLKTVTAADGSYEFNSVAAGEYSLCAKGSNYEEDEFDLIVEAGRQARADMQLTRKNTYVKLTTYPVVTTDGVTKFSLYATWNSKYPPIEAGYFYSTSYPPEKDGIKIRAGKKDYTATVKYLPSGIYYVVAYIINEIGIEYGNTETFKID